MATDTAVKNGTKTVRDERGRFVKGAPAGPGRPPNEHSITALLRAEVAARPDLVRALVEKANEDWRCAAWIIEHLEPVDKAALNVNVNVGVALAWADGEQA